ncbi:MAG: hypothetical protein ACLSIF_08425 [Faecalimonas umbilicata]
MNRVNRKRRKVRLWMALGFISCIALLVLADGITKERKFSEEENRMLATKPKASVETVMSGKFMSQYEKYKSDQFLGRDFWVSLKTKADLLLGKKDSNGVFKGADGYLLEEISVLDEASYKENMDAVTAFAARYPRFENAYVDCTECGKYFKGETSGICSNRRSECTVKEDRGDCFSGGHSMD